MNILKLQDELKGVPDNALVGYVQNPTGQVPTYLALGELQRRKTMREKFQQQQAPQTTVAEDLAAPPPPPPMQQGIAAVAPQEMAAPMAPPMPQQAPMAPPQGMAEGGVASLDVGNMYDEANYASGGIVAFADGGETGMNLDRLPSINLNFVTKPSESSSGNSSATQNILGNMGRMGSIGMETQRPTGIGIQGGINPRPWYEQHQNMSRFMSNTPGINAAQPTSYALNLNSGEQEAQYAQGGEVQRFAGLDGSYINPGLLGGSIQEGEPWYSDLEKWARKNLDWSATNKAMRDRADKGWPSEVSNPFLSGQPRTDIMQEYLDIKQKVNTGKGTYQDIERMKQIEGQGVPPVREPGGGGWTKEKQAAADAKDIQDKQAQLLKDKENALKNMANKNAGTGGAKEKIRSLSDYAKEFKDVIGEDPMQAKLMSRMEKMDARAAKQEELAPWMAALEAGLGIAGGKSQFALQNISEGALRGVKSYGDAQDKAAQLEEKRFGLMSDMAKAQRAEQIAIASKGADSRDAALAREQQYKIHQEDQALKLKLSVIENTFDLQKTQLTTAAKDLPNAVDRATKIDPLVIDDKDYKEGLKALEGKYGDKAILPGSPNYDKYQADVDALYRKIYAKKVRNPLAASSFGAGALSYTPGKGFN